MNERAGTQDGGELILAGTPIGDIDDASPRLRATLTEADVIAAEDTRRLTGLLKRLELDVTARIVSYFEGNESARTPMLLRALGAGDRVVLVTDAGMPSVSDPGFRLVAAAVQNGVTVRVVPGPSAVLAALAVSGLPVDRFCFEGFLPRRHGERRRRLADLVGEQRTMVFFEAPHRTHQFLVDAADAFGPGRRAAVCRELTKTYEETVRAGLGGLARWAEDGVRGEVTLVVEGATPTAPDPESAVGEVEARVADGVRLKAAVGEVADAYGLRRNVLYDAVLVARRGQDDLGSGR